MEFTTFETLALFIPGILPAVEDILAEGILVGGIPAGEGAAGIPAAQVGLGKAGRSRHLVVLEAVLAVQGEHMLGLRRREGQ
mmetsp:Transcript_21731/g.56433  ORF Transcript_21731/g.56433 Transcript_21731/m.56433 type:complete len:82 (+) Transcript_21731:1319-1564(+)